MSIPRHGATGLGSLYLSPRRTSAVHVIVNEDHMLCLPRVPLGRWEPRPDVPAPTCERCAALTQKVGSC